MDFFKNYNPSKVFLISFLGALVIVYPNIALFPWQLSYLEGHAKVDYIRFFIFRYAYFSLLIWLLLHLNLRRIISLNFRLRFIRNFLITSGAYLIYYIISYSTCSKADCFGSTLIFQFIVMSLLCSFVGHVYFLYNDQHKKEIEIENLKIENLQSRCDALANQINPHFFFNSLNSISALVRKKNDPNTLDFINKLSDVFRYILKSEKKGLTTLKEELDFVDSFKYLMEVRFANKLEFNIQVDCEAYKLKIPTLSLLPLIDNVVVHNTIDSEHHMIVTIEINDKNQLIVSNPIFPKLTPGATNGIGLKNLEKRFQLLMDQKIEVKNDEKTFSVILPLKLN
jgi:hypothetical protein